MKYKKNYSLKISHICEKCGLLYPTSSGNPSRMSMGQNLMCGQSISQIYKWGGARKINHRQGKEYCRLFTPDIEDLHTLEQHLQSDEHKKQSRGG